MDGYEFEILIYKLHPPIFFIYLKKKGETGTLIMVIHTGIYHFDQNVNHVNKFWEALSNI